MTNSIFCDLIKTVFSIKIMNSVDLSRYTYKFDLSREIPSSMGTYSVYDEVELKNELISEGWVTGPSKFGKYNAIGMYKPKSFIEKVFYSISNLF